MKILFVCLGNICRSAAADGVLHSMAEKAGKENDIIIDSAGTYGGHAGELPDRRMRAHGARRGYELTHRARKVRVEDFYDFDIIIAMDDNNYHDLRRMAPSPEGERKVVRFASYLTKHDATYVPDPYYEGAEGFEYVLDLLEEGCANILDTLK